jgi:Fur family ferric uptake transcriptional regulator
VSWLKITRSWIFIANLSQFVLYLQNMAEPLDQLKNTLKQHGQSLTRARQFIFAALMDKEPQTMREVVSACGGQVDRASVYRTIALFERTGIVQRLQIGWKYKLELSDAFHRHHHHLTCRRCGRTLPLPEDEALEKRLKSLADSQNFIMQGHQLEIHGLCKNCSKT